MNIASNIFCRSFQAAFRAALPFLPCREPEIITSCSARKSVFEKNIQSVLVVTDKGVVNNGLVVPLEQALHDNGVHFTIYAHTQPKCSILLL